MRTSMNGRVSGFTLIELVIAVAIVGILAAIAYPSYVEQARKSKRTDATATLLDYAQQLERCYTQFNGYNNASCTALTPLQSVAGAPSIDGTYSISIANLTATGYNLVASPIAGGDQAGDTKCARYTYTSTGAKQVDKYEAGAYVVGDAERIDYCW